MTKMLQSICFITFTMVTTYRYLHAECFDCKFKMSGVIVRMASSDFHGNYLQGL